MNSYLRIVRTYEVPLVAQIVAPAGGQIYIGSITRFILQLKALRGFNITSFSFDGFQSADAMQQLALAGLVTKGMQIDDDTGEITGLPQSFSVDGSNVQPYREVLEGCNERRVLLPRYALLRKELRELEVTMPGMAPDHSPTGSKDVADPVAGVLGYLAAYGHAELRAPGEIIVDRTDKAGRWLRIGQPTIWPWPWPPIVDAQNLPAPGQFWGRSDIDAVNIALTRAGIARASDLNRTARIHAHPTVTAKGMTPAQVQNIDLGNDKITALPGPDMSLDYVELPEGASTSVGWLGELHDQFREHSRVPAVAAGRLDAAGALSGVALRILFAPLLQSTSQKRLTYGRLIRDLTRRLLALGGWSGTVTVQWPDILPTNDLEVWQTASAEQAAGVSRETSLRSRGLDPDQEEQNRAEEAARAANRMTEPYTDPAGDAPQDPPTDPQPAPGA
jgi:hypothetical protein